MYTNPHTNQKRVSCIICAYNEEPRIGAVLTAVTGHPSLDEIIVVDDGSQDQTSVVAASFPSVKVIRLEQNRGKSAAMAAGIRAAQGELLCMLDADLQNLTLDDISSLVEPVLRGHTDACMGLCRRNWQLMGLDPISGQRTIPRSILANVTHELERLPRFGLEMFINELMIKHKLSLSIARFNSASNTLKIFKYGLRKGITAERKMATDVLSLYSPMKPFMQSYSLARLRSDVAWVRWLPRFSPERPRLTLKRTAHKELP